MEHNLAPLLGGMLLGLGLAIPLLLFGYAEGASGLIHGLAAGPSERRVFRLVMEGSMVLTGLLFATLRPGLFGGASERPLAWIAVAGVLVGVGAKRANGCTSGHGVLGVGRGSLRSFVAVTLFVVAATVVGTWWPASVPAEPRQVRGE